MQQLQLEKGFGIEHETAKAKITQRLSCTRKYSIKNRCKFFRDGVSEFFAVRCFGLSHIYSKKKCELDICKSLTSHYTFFICNF
jgi:hypothetical protein